MSFLRCALGMGGGATPRTDNSVEQSNIEVERSTNQPIIKIVSVLNCDMCLHACLSVRLSACLSVWFVCMYVYVCIYIYISLCMYVWVCTCAQVVYSFYFAAIKIVIARTVLLWSVLGVC